MNDSNDATIKGPPQRWDREAGRPEQAELNPRRKTGNRADEPAQHNTTLLISASKARARAGHQILWPLLSIGYRRSDARTIAQSDCRRGMRR